MLMGGGHYTGGGKALEGDRSEISRGGEDEEKEEDSRFRELGYAIKLARLAPPRGRQVSTPGDEATYIYRIGRNFIATHTAIAFFNPPTNGPFTSIVGPIQMFVNLVGL